MLILKRLASYIPTKLPVGMSEFETWSDSIIELAGEYADRDSMKYALATNVIHLPHTKARVAKAYFVDTLRKAAANQVASAVFQEIKFKQAEAAERRAALEKQQAEVAAQSEAACQNPTTQNG